MKAKVKWSISFSLIISVIEFHSNQALKLEIMYAREVFHNRKVCIQYTERHLTFVRYKHAQLYNQTHLAAGNLDVNLAK